jgi:membrane-bound metal-dependent hydrolase YbcI (DUF457 family)
VAPKPSLGTLFIAAQFIDLIWPLLLLLGLERVRIDPGNTVVTPLNFVHYPFSHSLLAVLIWAGLVGGIYFYIKRDRNGAIWLAALVMSHWLLDLITHRPDLPLWPSDDSVFVGLGLWNSLAGTLIVEFGIYALGVFLYARVTRARDKTGTWAFWGLVVFLALIHIMNVFGPPPAEEGPIAYVGFAQWLLVAWAYWIDRHREVRG